MSGFIFNMPHQGAVADAITDASLTKDEVSRYKNRLEDLEFALNRTSLACQALWELLRSRVEITEAELIAKISEVDLRDGVKDQRMTPHLIQCPQCNRTLNSKASRCLYCGAAVTKQNVFE
jgi:hypothetical protein